MDPLQLFKEEIEAFLDFHAMSPSAFGEKAVGDPRFVFQIRDGRQPRWATIEVVRKWMREYRAPAHAGT